MAETLEEEYISRLQDDPGDECFADYAEYLRLQDRSQEAILVSIAGLSANPSFHKGRLMLARLFFECGYLLFAIREIRELRAALPANMGVKRLLEVLERDRKPDEEEKAPGEEQMVAQTDFDIDDLAE